MFSCIIVAGRPLAFLRDLALADGDHFVWQIASFVVAFCKRRERRHGYVRDREKRAFREESPKYRYFISFVAILQSIAIHV